MIRRVSAPLRPLPRGSGREDSVTMWFFIFIAICTSGAAHAGGDQLAFPAGFKFGVASASYQVEGAWNHSDKGESIWDRMTHTFPERISEGATGDVACDSYRQYKTDVRLASNLGAHFYRISLSWPRLLPTGFANKVSKDGSQYYNDLIDELLKHNIQPVVTLYHWDLPQRLQDLGGWTNPEIQKWFADYARVVFSLYADRVKTWITINEPIVMCDFAYGNGIMAPGVHDPEVAPHLCAKNVLMSHAAAYRIYDTEYRHKYHGEVSLSNHMVWFEPDTPEDDEVAELMNQYSAGRYSEPIFGEGGWPAAVEQLMEENSAREGYPRSRLPTFTQEEIDFVKGTYDFYGLNHYTSRTVRHSGQPTPRVPDGFGWPLDGSNREVPADVAAREQWHSGNNAWLKVNPAGLRNSMMWIKQHYGDVPILITENGYATGGGLDDVERVNYYRDYLEQVLLAIKEDGVKVTGYTAWTLMDNFEWMDGYTTKFGLYEVDFTAPSRPRSPRRSARYYASVIKHHSLDIPHNYEKDEL